MMYKKCDYCQGKRSVDHLPDWTKVTCPKCNGTGVELQAIKSTIANKIGIWFDKHLSWHSPVKGTEFSRGINNHATCKYCGKDVIQDSQGNWF